jgi:hypothetical protein
MVKEALKERPPSDIALLPCRHCDNYSYYNEGGHFTCAWCIWSASGGDLDALVEEGLIHLADYEDPENDPV